MITFELKRAWVDFSFKTNAQGLILSNFESWGTETANYANFVRFSFVFTHFASETYKTQSLRYFQYFDAFLSVFWMFCSSDLTKNDECLSTHQAWYLFMKLFDYS